MSKKESFKKEGLNEDQSFESFKNNWLLPEGFNPIVGEDFIFLSLETSSKLTRKKGLLELIKHYLRFGKKNFNKT